MLRECENIGFSRMRRLRLGSALAVAFAGMALSAAVCAALWPHARDAGAILAAQDEPASSPICSSILPCGTAPALVAENIEAALAADDSDLAASFVELARDKGIAVSEELSKRVSDAVTESNSTSDIARRFATGLVTGNADDVASLSGTVAGDLFVFGDIRDVVREGKHLATGEDVDRLVLGLATVGLAVTAATYVSVGGVGAGARRPQHGQGSPQGRAAGRGADAMGRTLGARGRRCTCVAAGGRKELGAAAGRDRQRDQGGVPCREGRRAGAAGEGRRTRRRKGRHARRARYAAHRARPEGRRTRRAAGGIQGRPDPRHPEDCSAAARCCWQPAPSI